MEYGKVFDVPVPLLLAISKQESSFNPHAVNVAGRSYFPTTQAEASTIAKKAQRQGKSFDVGIMQVNSWWLRRYSIDVESALDPRINILLGTFILSEEIRRAGGINWKSVGAYHSPRQSRQKTYAKSILKQLASLDSLSRQK